MFSSVTSQRFGPILLGPPLSKVWQVTHTLASCSPLFGSALASSGSIGSSLVEAVCSPGAAATCSAPAGIKTGFSRRLGSISWLARIPQTHATISAVRTEAMILFHSNADIDDLFPPGGRVQYHASDNRTNRACCRCPNRRDDVP